MPVCACHLSDSAVTSQASEPRISPVFSATYKVQEIWPGTCITQGTKSSPKENPMSSRVKKFAITVILAAVAVAGISFSSQQFKHVVGILASAVWGA